MSTFKRTTGSRGPKKGSGGRHPAYDDLVHKCIAYKRADGTLTLEQACERINAEHQSHQRLLSASTLRKRVSALTKVYWDFLPHQNGDPTVMPLTGPAAPPAVGAAAGPKKRRAPPPTDGQDGKRGRPTTSDDMVLWCIGLKRLIWQRYGTRITAREAVRFVEKYFPVRDDDDGEEKRVLAVSTLRKRVM